MSVETKPNKLVKGLVLDTFHTDVDNTVATYALNSQLEDQEGNHFHYGSEVGTTFIKNIPDTHVVVGHINMERNETVLFTTDGTNSTIGILSRNDDMSYQYEIKVDDTKQTKKLGFKKNIYIRGVYRLLNGCDKIIYFVDGINKDRRINLNQLDSYKLPTTVTSAILFVVTTAIIRSTSTLTGDIKIIRVLSPTNIFTQSNVVANLIRAVNFQSNLSSNSLLVSNINFVQKAQASLLATGTTTADLTVGSSVILVDYLVVAGGGGGGVAGSSGGAGGGGGAGGARCTVNQTGGGGLVEPLITLSNGVNYSIIIGGGGVGALRASSGNSGGPGNNSVFNNITSIGGGGGARSYSTGTTIATQGRIPSGGGGWTNTGIGLGAIGTLNQSFAGGNASYPNIGAGGGGGAGQIGQNGSNIIVNGGKGGDGITTNITNTNIIYAGGGGGAAQNSAVAASGGAGGGGNGGNVFNSKTSTDGSVNTGGGGGGDTLVPSGLRGGSGGSGIIILKIPDTVTATFSAGVTQTTSISGGFKIITITAAGLSDTVTFS